MPSFAGQAFPPALHSSEEVIQGMRRSEIVQGLIVSLNFVPLSFSIQWGRLWRIFAALSGGGAGGYRLCVGAAIQPAADHENYETAGGELCGSVNQQAGTLPNKDLKSNKRTGCNARWS
jgi:hypothetical protein